MDGAIRRRRRRVVAEAEPRVDPAVDGRAARLEKQSLPARLTIEQIKSSPDVDTDRPVSLQHQAAIFLAYGLTPPDVLYPAPFLPPIESVGDPHLRSAKHVIGYKTHAADGEIGHVFDFVAEDDHWTIRYMVVATGDWLPGRKVLVSPRWIDSIQWEGIKVAVSLSRAVVRDSPQYDPQAPINREYEFRLYDYHGRPAYWG